MFDTQEYRRTTLYYVAIIGIPVLCLTCISYYLKGLMPAFYAAVCICGIAIIAAASAKFDYYVSLISNSGATIILFVIYWMVYKDVKPSGFVFWAYAAPPLGFLCLGTISGTIVSLLCFPAILIATSVNTPIYGTTAALFNQEVILLSFVIVAATSGVGARLLESKNTAWQDAQLKLSKIEAVIGICTGCNKMKIGDDWQSQSLSANDRKNLPAGLCPSCQPVS